MRKDIQQFFSCTIQQEDLVALGRLVLALACYSIEAVQRDNVKQSLEFVARNYSNDLKSLIW